MKRRSRLACIASSLTRVRVALQVRQRHHWRPALVIPCLVHTRYRWGIEEDSYSSSHGEPRQLAHRHSTGVFKDRDWVIPPDK